MSEGSLPAVELDLGLDVVDLRENGGILRVRSQLEVQELRVVACLGGIDAVSKGDVKVVELSRDPLIKGIQEGVDLVDGELNVLAWGNAMRNVRVPLVDPGMMRTR